MLWFCFLFCFIFCFELSIRSLSLLNAFNWTCHITSEFSLVLCLFGFRISLNFLLIVYNFVSLAIEEDLYPFQRSLLKVYMLKAVSFSLPCLILHFYLKILNTSELYVYFMTAQAIITLKEQLVLITYSIIFVNTLFELIFSRHINQLLKILSWGNPSSWSSSLDLSSHVY